jgi:BASS family bile acid:Na+ symporter
MPVKGLLTDWSFFIVMYTIIGTNRNLIFEKPIMIVLPAFVAFAATFLLGFVIEKIGSRLDVAPADRISLKLLGTLKNLGISGGLALSLFSKEAALPSAIYNIFMILYFIWLDFSVHLPARGPDRHQKGSEITP